MKKLSLLLFTLLLTISCAQQQQPQPAKELTFAEKVEATHQKSSFLNNESMQFDIVIHFGGNEILNGQVTARTDLSKIRIDLGNDTITYDGTNVYLSPSASSYRGARFNIFTWTYFLALPFKLTDPGTNWNDTEYNTLNEVEYVSQKLTFGENVGDSPDDWYIVFADKEAHQLYAASYIVTLTTAVEEAEKDPHAIVYHDYQEFNGVPISTRWTFHNWNTQDDLGEQIGDAALSNFTFLEVDDAFFEKPEDAKMIGL